jgi:hypothetical protein
MEIAIYFNKRTRGEPCKAGVENSHLLGGLFLRWIYTPS